MRLAIGLLGLVLLIMFGTTMYAPAAQKPLKAPAASSAALRIAIVGLPEGCGHTPSDGAAKAYVAHLHARLGKPVSLCGAKDMAGAAHALKSGAVEMALLDSDGYGLVGTQARAILAPRFSPENGRVLGVALTLKTSRFKDLATLAGAHPIFITAQDSGHAIPLAALMDFGVDVKKFGSETIVKEDEAITALRQKKGDVLIITAGARQRLCRSDDPKIVLCDDMAEIWRGRPAAPLALVVNNTLSEPDRYQLIGIHIALHKDNSAAFAFVSTLMPKAMALDPTEPTALVKGAH